MHRQQGDIKLMALLCVATFFAVTNNTVFNVAIPLIQEDYHLTAGQVSLVAVVYLAIFSVGTMIYGKMADFLCLRKLYIVGLLLFMAGSFVGYGAENYIVLLVARMIQACGAAAVHALSMLAFNQFFAVRERLQGIMLMAVTASLGAGIGPVIGGIVSQYFGYSFLFLFSSTVGLLVPGLLFWMPLGATSRGGTMDLAGCLLFSTAIFMILVGISVNVSLLIVGLCLFAFFLFYASKCKAAFIPLTMFQNKMFSLLLLIGMLVFLVSIGNLFLFPMVLKRVNLLPTALVGYAMVPGAVCAVFSGKLAQKMYGKYGALATLYVVLGEMAVGFFLISLSIGQSYLLLSLFVILIYTGFGAVQVILGNFMFEVLDKSQVNVGLGLYNLCTFVGGALGPALSAMYLDQGWQPALNYWNHSSAFCDSYMLLLFMIGIALLLLGVARRQRKIAVPVMEHNHAVWEGNKG